MTATICIQSELHLCYQMILHPKAYVEFNYSRKGLAISYLLNQQVLLRTRTKSALQTAFIYFSVVTWGNNACYRTEGNINVNKVRT